MIRKATWNATFDRSTMQRVLRLVTAAAASRIMIALRKLLDQNYLYLVTEARSLTAYSRCGQIITLYVQRLLMSFCIAERRCPDILRLKNVWTTTAGKIYARRKVASQVAHTKAELFTTAVNIKHAPSFIFDPLSATPLSESACLSVRLFHAWPGLEYRPGMLKDWLLRMVRVCKTLTIFESQKDEKSKSCPTTAQSMALMV